MPKLGRLRELRDRAMLSQEELAGRARISRATVADLETGKRGAQAATGRKLAEALGVSPGELVGEEVRR